MKLSYKKAEENYYDVFFNGIYLGMVYKDIEAWSIGRWFIYGIPQELAPGGVNDNKVKVQGYYTREKAARKLAQMRSSLIIEAMP